MPTSEKFTRMAISFRLPDVGNAFWGALLLFRKPLGAIWRCCIRLGLYWMVRLRLLTNTFSEVLRAAMSVAATLEGTMPLLASATP